MSEYTKKSKIALIGNTSWSMYNFRKGLIGALINSGYKVIVIAPEDDFTERLKQLGCNHYSLKMSGNGVNPFSEFVVILKLFLILRKIKPDFLISYTIKPNIYASICGKFNGVRCISVVTGLGYIFTKKGFIPFLANSMYKMAFKFPLEIWFLNKDDRDLFLDKKLVGSEKTRIINGEGVDTEYFTPEGFIDNAASSKFTFTLIARMIKDKGVEEFVCAAKILKGKKFNFRFCLMGAHDVENPRSISRLEIMKWVDAGFVEYIDACVDVRPVISFSDCIVLPSYYREGVPRILMEASAMQKPIITTNNIGCKEVIIDGITGVICNMKDPDSLATACEKIFLMESSERQKMGEAGRMYIIKYFSENIVISEYLRVLEKYL
ncbi:MAG: glycosyltransferase family 4 protein [Enterobacteriaceae bacterium]